MLVIDTSAMIEVYLDSSVGRQCLRHFPPRAETIIPTIVQFELAKWLAREVDELVVRSALADTMECVVAPLDSGLAARAAWVAGRHKLATADAIVYATVLEHDAELLTCDAHFEGLPGVLYIAKS